MCKTRPACRQCGKPLQKHIGAEYIPAEDNPADWIGRVAPGWRGKYKLQILEITRTYSVMTTTSGKRMLSIAIWCGEFGYRGEGLFCSLRCGYSWATNHIKETDNGT